MTNDQKIDEIILKLDAIEKILSVEKEESTLEPEEKWLDVKETAKFLKISTRTLASYRNQHLLPYSQIAAKIYFRYSDIIDFLMMHRTEKSANT